MLGYGKASITGAATNHYTDINVYKINKQNTLSKYKTTAITNRLVSHLKAGNLSLTGIEIVAIDEADLVMAHDFELDIREITLNMSSSRKHQIFVCSTTLNPHTTDLQKHFLMHHPTVIQIDQVSFAKINN
ncbi:ATP-dependent RNA helicase dbp2 [Reticulomyxa filosa]|uniref:ATP-dependent RNA helicase dbp2 n=1 Tax=Reticulomyxa filosa TaxID=46433 RepID=X6LS08_RETFI|nr:ATP-dependent RNA helicase dbp2 [Reticulomyxa filosa]|eukprot:ETO04693.1 ATP-dependent RNA helicase dbp2 [Reticulomyxa filosa]